METKKHLRVLHVVIALNMGGLERFVVDLIKINSKTFFQHVVCLESLGSLANDCPVEICSLDMTQGFHLSIVWKIRRLIKELNINVIHTHNEKAQLYGGLAGLLSGVPVIHTKHGRNSHTYRAITRNYLSSLLCKKVVAVSTDAAVECTEIEKISNRKVKTILNGIDVDSFSPGQKAETVDKFTKESVVRIGIVARLASIKDHSTLFRACALLAKCECRFKLYVVGDGPLRKDLNDLVDSLAIRDYVDFMGERGDIANIMKGFDVFVLSSISEGISLTLLEAMSTGLPVVATDVGGNPEVVVDSVTGFLVPAQNPQIMAERIKTLILNPDLRVEMGIKGRERVVNRFSLAESAKNYAEQYKLLAGN